MMVDVPLILFVPIRPLMSPILLLLLLLCLLLIWYIHTIIYYLFMYVLPKLNWGFLLKYLSFLKGRDGERATAPSAAHAPAPAHSGGPGAPTPDDAHVAPVADVVEPVVPTRHLYVQ